MLQIELQVPTWAAGLMLMALLIIAVLMILVVLIQKPQGGGLSSAFGAGAGSGQTAFGAKTGDMLTWVTVGFFVAFISGAVLLNYVARADPSAVPQAAPTGQPTGQPTGPQTTGDPNAPALPPVGGEGSAPAGQAGEGLPDEPPAIEGPSGGDQGGDPVGDPVGDPGAGGAGGSGDPAGTGGG